MAKFILVALKQCKEMCSKHFQHSVLSESPTLYRSVRNLQWPVKACKVLSSFLVLIWWNGPFNMFQTRTISPILEYFFLIWPKWIYYLAAAGAMPLAMPCNCSPELFPRCTEKNFQGKCQTTLFVRIITVCVIYSCINTRNIW